MPVSHVFGKVAIPDSDFKKWRNRPAVGDFLKTLGTPKAMRGKSRISVDYEGTPLHLTDFRNSRETPVALAIGKPMTVSLVHIYTGDKGKKGLLVTSRMRDTDQNKDVAPRALNLLTTRKVDKRQHLPGVRVSDRGCAVMFCSPAYMFRRSGIDVELSWDDVDSEAWKNVSDFLKGAAGSAAIPALAPYAGVLVLASFAVKLIGNLLERRLDGDADKILSLDIRLGIEGAPEFYTGYKILAEKQSVADSLLYFPSESDVDKRLVNKSDGQPYRGVDPVVVLLFEAATAVDPKDFQILLATAEMTKGFIQDKKEQEPLFTKQDIQDIGGIFNDWKLKKNIDSTERLLERARTQGNSSEVARLEKLKQALQDNKLTGTVFSPDGNAKLTRRLNAKTASLTGA